MPSVLGIVNGAAGRDFIVSAFVAEHEWHVFTLAGLVGDLPMSSNNTWRLYMKEADVGYIQERRVTRPAIVGDSNGGLLAIDTADATPSLLLAIVNAIGQPCLVAALSPSAPPNSVRLMAEQMRRIMFADWEPAHA